MSSALVRTIVNNDIKISGVEMDRENLENILSELQRRKTILVSIANNSNLPLDNTDREHIHLYLEQKKVPERPKTEPDFLKVYASSCLSYSVIRKCLTGLIGEIPTPDTIPRCLELVFGESGFRQSDNWTPDNLNNLMREILHREHLSDSDLTSKELKPRIIAVLLDGSDLFRTELKNGLGVFYDKVLSEVESGPDSAWRFVEDFSKRIRHVGPVLFCDFLKNIGFPEFVKVDYHFQKEFPNLIQEKLSTKKQFIRSLELCNILGITPFYFDHLMYQWGRYKSLHKNKFQHLKTTLSINEKSHDENSEGKKRFEKLIQQNKKWQDECTKLTVHRQIQLEKIFDKYGGDKIPFSHFTHEICRNFSLRNSEAYPAVCAYLSGILREENDSLIKPDGIIWGERELSNMETFWL